MMAGRAGFTSRSLGRRALGKWAPAVRESLHHSRLSALEQRLERVEQRLRMDVTARLSDVMYRLDRLPRSLADAEFSIYSQNGEDGILLYLLSALGRQEGRFIEIGIGDGTECCCANLALNWGWSGIMVEGDTAAASAARHFYAGRADTVVKSEFVTVENVNSIVPEDDIDVLSLDIDGNDYWVWQAMRASASVAVIEYNASFGSVEAVTIPYDPTFMFKQASEHHMYHGASLAALTKLANAKGMSLVGCDSQGVNAFFVQRSLLGHRIAEHAVEDAWRPHTRRTRLRSQAVQESMLASQPVVYV